jgi:hypothetical protein
LVTFAIFAKAAWGMSRFYAYRLIEAGKTVENLLPIGNIHLITSESQIRLEARAMAALD